MPDLDTATPLRDDAILALSLTLWAGLLVLSALAWLSPEPSDPSPAGVAYTLATGRP